MLQTIRNKAQGVVAWLIVIAITVVFTLWGVNGFSGSERQNQFAAKVNDHKISWQQIERHYQNFIRQHAQDKNFDINQINPRAIKSSIRDILVDDTALLDETMKSGYRITDTQFKQILHQTPGFQQDGKFSVEKYHQFVQQMGVGEAQVQRLLKEKLLLTQPEQAIVFSGFALQDEIEALAKLVNQKRDFGYAIVPHDKYLSEVNVSEAQVQEHYNKHRSSYLSPPKVSIEFLEISVNNVADRIEPSEDELEAFYQTHINYYTNPELVKVRHILVAAERNSQEETSGEARNKIEDILAKIKVDGQNFAELAKTESDDTLSAQEGGSLGWLGHGDVVPEFEKVAFELENPGDISEVFQTDFGYHIIQLEEKQPKMVQSYETVRDKVALQYRQEKAEALFADKAEELANLTFENPYSLDVAASTLGLEIQKREYIAQGADVEDSILRNPRFNAAMFDANNIAEKKNSELIKLDDEHYAVLRVIESIPSQQQMLDEVKSQIESELRNKQAIEKAKSLGDTFRQALERGEAPFKLAQTLGIEWQYMRDIDRYNEGVPRDILRQAFRLPEVQENQVSSRVFSLSSGDCVVISLSKVKNGQLSKDQSGKMDHMFSEYFEKTLPFVEYALYKRAMVERAKIEINKLPE